MISYYELLGMIKEDKEPNKIKVHLTSIPQVYVREDDLDDTFSYYGLEEEEKEDSDYHYYLAECFLESDMFEKNIEILDEKRINDKARFQYSQLPSWIDKKEMINVINEDEETSEDYKYYLTDCYIESMMFEKNIEILEEEKELHANKIVFN